MKVANFEFTWYFLKTPVASDSLKRIDKGKAISSATILRAAGGISSGPAALDGSRSFSSCRTSGEETGENSHSECLVAFLADQASKMSGTRFTKHVK